MCYFAAIVSIIALAAFAGPVWADGEGAVPDSAALAVDTAAAGDTLARGGGRRAAYLPAAPDSARAFDPLSFNASDIFRSDGADAAEALRYRALTSVSIPLTLSGSLNRVLPYGSPAMAAYPSRRPSTRSAPSPRFWGGGAVSAAQADGFDAGPGEIFYQTPPDALTPPELSIFWENGVFEQNTFNLRLSRPLSQNLMLSAFSSYRYLNGQRFNHERSDIMNFYKFFNPDTSTIMNNGYNPLADEHALGGALLRANADSSKLRASFSYGKFQNEYALNTPSPSLDRLNWALLDRRIYRVDAALLDKQIGRAWRADIRAAFVNEALSTSHPRDTAVNGSGESRNFVIDAELAAYGNWGLSVESMVRNIEFYNGTDKFFSENHAELFYTYRFSPGATLHARAGAMVSPRDTSYYSRPDLDDGPPTPAVETAFAAIPTGSAAFEFLSRDSSARLNVFAKSGYSIACPDYDTERYEPLGWAGSNTVIGAEGQIRSRYLGLLVGYQHYAGSYSLWEVWPEWTPPYKQPANVFIIAPWASRYRGFSLLSRAIITDTKPYLKAAANLSYIIQPKGMAHTFETELGFDYWSERNPFQFAGHTGWNDPIYDLNLKVTAHIKTFRLFYKVDNLLNLRQAYVPGYFNPGLTFRWGINWFVQ